MDKIISAITKDDDGDEGHGQPLPGGNKSHGGAFPAGGGFFFGGDDEDMKKAAEDASRQAGDHGDTDLFSNVLGMLGQKKEHIANSDLDEADAVQKHRTFFGGEDDDKEADAGGLGAAAAVQALKMFSSGEHQGGQSQGAFMALAMSEASKLFDAKAAKGNVASGETKQSAVEEAGKMAMMMYLKSQGQSSSGSGGGLMSMASKFL